MYVHTIHMCMWLLGFGLVLGWCVVCFGKCCRIGFMEQIGAFLPLILILTILVIYYFYKRNKQKKAGIVEVQEELFGFGKLINIIFVIPFLVIFGLVAHFIDITFSWESTGGADFTLFQTYWLSAALFAIPLCFNLFFYPRTDANKREKYI